MTYMERIREAISKLRDHIRSLVSGSEVGRLREELQAATREREQMAGAVEAFAEEIVSRSSSGDGSNDEGRDG